MSTLVAVAWCRRASSRRPSPRCRRRLRSRVVSGWHCSSLRTARLVRSCGSFVAAVPAAVVHRVADALLRRVSTRGRVSTNRLACRLRASAGGVVSRCSSPSPLGGCVLVVLLTTRKRSAVREPDLDPQRHRVSSVRTASRGWSWARACGSTTRGGRRLCENQTPSHAATSSDCLAAVGPGRGGRRWRMPGDRRAAGAGRVKRKQVMMSRSGILDALRDEERSLKNQLVAIQRAIEAIEGADTPARAARGRKQARKVVPKRKRAMTEEQRKAVSERMRQYWASRRADKG